VEEGFDSDFVTAKFNISGTKVWESRYNARGNAEDLCFWLCLDESDDVYVVGRTTSLKTGDDFLVVKLDSEGNGERVAKYSGSAEGNETPSGAAVDSWGNVFVLGETKDPNGLPAITTIKYDPSGRLLWEVHLRSEGDSLGAGGIGIDSGGNVYVSGSVVRPGPERASVVAKYDGEGNELWRRFYDLGPCLVGGFPTIVVGPGGRVYVTVSTHSPQSTCGIRLLCYAPDGRLEWTAPYYEPGSDVYQTFMTGDNAGGVYIVGYSKPWGGVDRDAEIFLRYDGDGDLLWRKSYPAEKFDDLNVAAICADGESRLYATGSRFTPPEKTMKFFTLKLDADGGEEWLRVDEESGIECTRGIDLSCDGLGNVYVVALPCSETEDLMIAAKYRPNGEEEWTVSFKNPGFREASAYAIAVDRGGNAVLLGTVLNPETSTRDVLVLKYSEVQTAFRRGDPNGDGKVDVADAIFLLGFLFGGNPETLPCEKAGDVDDGGETNLADPIQLLQYLFAGGEPPQPPFRQCGPDPTLDRLSCDSYPSCR